MSRIRNEGFASMRVEPEIERGRPKEHPAYAVIEIHRVSGDRALFDSNVSHQGYVTIRICKASAHDTELSEHVMGHGEQYIEVALSEAQFVQAITRMNSSGTPCTLTRVRDGKLKAVEPLNHVETFADKLFRRSRVNDQSTRRRFNEQMKGLRALCEDLPVRKRQAFLHELEILDSWLVSTHDFHKEELTKHAEKAVTAAKVEIDAFVKSTVTRLGLRSLGDLSEALRLKHDTDAGDGHG